MVNLFSFFGLFNALKANGTGGLGDIMAGLDSVSCEGYTSGSKFTFIFIALIAITVLFYAVKYHIIDSLRNKKGSCWMFALFNLIVCFAMAFGVSYNALGKDGAACAAQLAVIASPGIIDCLMMGVSGAIWSFIFFAFITSLPFPRNFSTNNSGTTLWKP